MRRRVRGGSANRWTYNGARRALGDQHTMDDYFGGAPKAPKAPKAAKAPKAPKAPKAAGGPESRRPAASPKAASPKAARPPTTGKTAKPAPAAAPAANAMPGGAPELDLNYLWELECHKCMAIRLTASTPEGSLHINSLVRHAPCGRTFGGAYCDSTTFRILATTCQDEVAGA